MEPSVEEARDALQQIARAERAADRHSVNNGLLTLIWGGAVFLFVTAFGFLPRLLTPENIVRFSTQANPWKVAAIFALGVSIPIVATAAWSSFYRKRLPVKAPDSEYRRFWTKWGLYHMVLIFGYFLGAPLLFHRTPSLGDCAVLGLIDAAPLLYTGIRQWRQAREERS